MGQSTDGTDTNGTGLDGTGPDGTGADHDGRGIAGRDAIGREVADQVEALVGADVAARLTLTGPAEVLPSMYRVTTLAAVSVAVAAVGAGRLLSARSGGGDPPLTVDTRHAAAAFGSERHLRVDGRPLLTAREPISGFYRTADDRWIQLHCTFPHHRDGVLDLLGVPGKRDAVARVVRGVDAATLETELQAMGLCASMARTEAEWSRHPQAAALAEQPVLEIERLDDSPPRPLVPCETPAAGVRVLDLTRVIAGPVAGRTLAAHGADVLRVGAAHLPEVDMLLVDTGFGKRNTFLNLRVGADARRLRELIASADVLLAAYRPRALDRLGFDADAVARLRPGIIYATISGYGRTGPWSGLRGFDSLVQTASGMTLAGKAADDLSEPVLLPVQALDHASGYLAAGGILDALSRRVREGGSWHVRVSLARTGRLLQDLGRHDTRAMPEPGPEDLEPFRDTYPSEFGELSYIRPPATVAGVAPRWTRPPARLGTSAPSWSIRS
ncbi:CoA-transferase family III [Frankia sp. AiPs1]|uniref:CoA transferase n=1 Tax=Frankia sp. AiPa1 TaxID=573492 RepID=UPI00202B753D|nr:CoA transferase [Frankia sp. AiPa1]MCL9762007.1 CoA transferase [Frankia sp. AiPa1]